MVLVIGVLAGCRTKPASTDAPASAYGSAEEWPAFTDQYIVNMRDAILSNNEDVETTIKNTQDKINELLK